MLIAIIPAKYNSKRLKNKNLLIIKNKSLLEHSIDYVKKSKKIQNFFVSTESKRIQNMLKKKNIKFINRPKRLCGEAPLIEVYRHAYNVLKKKYNINILAGIQCDHPDRSVKLDKAIETFKKKKLDILSSKNKFGKKNGAHHILNLKGLFDNNPKIGYILDDCTNIHFKSDLKKAEKKII